MEGRGFCACDWRARNTQYAIRNTQYFRCFPRLVYLRRELQWGNCVSAITSTSEIDVELRARGHRLTPRRLMVVEVLVERTGHLTVEELLAGVQAHYPSTNK